MAGVIDARATTVEPMFLGDDLLAYMVLALGGALAAGNIMAMVRPPAQPREDDLARAPVARSVLMVVIGGVAAGWGAASLLLK